jgi:hypothetical protein
VNSKSEVIRRDSDSDLERQHMDFLEWQYTPRKPFAMEMEKIIADLRAEMRRAAREAFGPND